jgi:hypothetical protein
MVAPGQRAMSLAPITRSARPSSNTVPKARSIRRCRCKTPPGVPFRVIQHGLNRVLVGRYS